MSEFILEANDISKRYDERDILRDATVNVRPYEIVSVLGLKGSGKTSLASIIAGFDAPSGGSVLMNGESITRTPVHKRGICSVFTDSVLFPDMTVYDNLVYPLKIRGFNKADMRDSFRCAEDIAYLKGLSKKYPHELTAAEQKRALIARAAVASPPVLLLDEPFLPFPPSERMDAVTMVRELKKEFELSVICMTADNEAAIQLSERVFVLRSGKTVQSGPPSYLYSRPRTSFAAQLFGRASIIKGRAAAVSEFITVDTGSSLISVYNNSYAVTTGSFVTIFTRPENVHVGSKPTGNSLKGVIVEQVFSSASTTVRIKAGASEIFHTMPGMSRFNDGDIVYAELDPRKTYLIDVERNKE